MNSGSRLHPKALPQLSKPQGQRRQKAKRAELNVGPPAWHRILFALVLALFALATLFGATTSSIAMPQLTQDGRELTGSHFGTLQPIRSDEYNVFTPVQLSTLAGGGEPTLSPLGTDASLVLRYPNGPFQSLVFWDTGLLRLGPWLPDAQLFAAHWWLPSLIVLLCMPTWMVLMGGRRHLGWLAGVLVVLAPSNFWWSMQPTMLIAYTLAGCTAMLAASQRFRAGQRVVPVAQCVLAGVCIAGMPSNYIMWSLLLGGGILLASAVRILTRPDKAGLAALLLSGVLAAVLGLGVIAEGLSGLRSVTETIYPGQRRSSAAPVGTELLFGAPTTSALQGEAPTSSNASELSSAYTIALVVLPFAWLASASRLRRRVRLPEIVLGAWGLLWLLWCMSTIGTLGTRVPVLSSVTPERAAQAIGVVGVIALCLALSHVRQGNRQVAAVAGALAAVLTVQAGALLRQNALPTMDLKVLWGAALLTGLVVALLIASPRRWYPGGLAAACAVLVVLHASPLQFGLGDLRESTTAQSLSEAGDIARSNGTYWASDIGPFDTVMLANGVPSLSGFQRSGPRADQWERIDPEGNFERAWNRGGGYSAWHWEEGAATRVESDGYDLISTTIDPCTAASAFPELSTIASSKPLEASSCLAGAGSLRWNGQDVHIYTVRR